MGLINSVEGLLNIYHPPNHVRLNGYCNEKFILVKRHLENMLKHGAEENLQLCVYVDGKCVVDLYGTATNDWNYGPDTIQVRKNQLGLHLNPSENLLGISIA